MLLLDAFGVFIGVTLAFAVWGPDVWRWLATHLGLRAPAAAPREPSWLD